MAFDLAQLVANIIPKKKDGATFPAMGVIDPTVEPFNKIENVNTQGIGPVPLGGADPDKYILPVTPPMMEQFPGSGRPETTATPAPQNPLDILNQQRQGILDKDYSIKKDDLGNITHRGVDRDTDHNWWDVVKSIGAGIGRTALQANAQGRQMELGEFLGSALGGGIGGGVNRNYDEQFVDEVKLQGLDQKIGRQMAQDEAKAKLDLTRAQTATIPIDDQLKREQILAQQQAAQQRITATALGKLTGYKHYDPKNQAHQALAKQAGLNPETLQGWDDRDPVTKKVAGTTYEYNRSTQSFEPSDLPVDERETMTDYSVTMPNGEVRKYRVAQKDAANFSTQMSTLGARLEHTTSERKAKESFEITKLERQQNFQKELKNLEAKIGREKATAQAQDEFKKEFFKQNGRVPTKAEMDAYTNAAIMPAFEVQASAEVIQ